MKTRTAYLAIALCISAAALAAGCEDKPGPESQSTGAPTGSATPKPALSGLAPVQHSGVPALPLPHVQMPTAEPLAPTPPPLAELKVPEDNPQTAEKVELGRELFFDKRLSKDKSASCETCHVPEKGWTDGNKLSTKVGGGVNTRHSPTLINVGYNDLYYWDGRAPTLDKQIVAAWKGQMGAEDPAAIAADLKKMPAYLIQFRTVFKEDPTPDNIVKALASFVRTIRYADAPWDKHDKGDKTAVSEDAVKGFEIFRNKAGCAACHAPPLFTDNLFHNVGIGSDAKENPDTGRGKVTSDKKDDGAFKTPTLRQVGLHPPYFHDGRGATLEEAVDLMLGGGIKNPNLDAKLKPVKLSKDERAQLLAFLKSLETPITAYKRPVLPGDAAP